MDLYPLYNSLRISLISTLLIFCLAVPVAWYTIRLSRPVKALCDCVFTLPLVLPPTVVGYLLLRILGPKRIIGSFVLSAFGIRLTMNWWSAVFSTMVVIFPLMYRTARGAFEALDSSLIQAGEVLGLGKTFLFFRIVLPNCKQGMIAGVILSFARAIGEYGATSMIAGYIPGKTATVSTTVYQLWRTNQDALALRWVLINMALSAVVLLLLNLMETKSSDGLKQKKKEDR